jgi:hypothetical protein
LESSTLSRSSVCSFFLLGLTTGVDEDHGVDLEVGLTAVGVRIMGQEVVVEVVEVAGLGTDREVEVGRVGWSG